MAGPAEQRAAARARRMRPLLAGAALGFAVLAPVLVLAGVIGIHAGVFGPRLGLGLMTLSLAPLAALLGAVLGVVALLFAILVPPRHAFVTPLAAILIGGGVSGCYALLHARAAATPPIHDVATDWREPLAFTPKLMSARGTDADPVQPAPVAPGSGGAAGEPVAAINARTCPAATPITLTQPVDAAYTLAKRALTGGGLGLVTDDRGAGVLEATATSTWFALKNDIAARVRPEGAGSRVDLRAVGRLGVNDLGAGCALITRVRRAIAG